MIETTSQPIHFFRQHDWNEVFPVIRKLADFVVRAEMSEIEGIGGYALKLADYITDRDEKDSIWLQDKEILSFLQIDLVEQFITNPNDENIKNILLQQLEYLSVATSNELHQLDLYYTDDIKKILSGQMPGYSVLSFIYTLRQAMIGFDTIPYISVLAPFLEITSVQEQASYDWTDALMINMILRVAWGDGFYRSADAYIQISLMESYLYKSIVLGIPVRQKLEEYLHNAIDLVDFVFYSDFLLDLVNHNRENIPLDVSGTKFLPVLDLVKNFESNSGTDVLDGYKLQKFVDSMYADQVGREKYKNWLREFMYIVTRIKRASLVDNIASDDENSDEAKEKNEHIKLYQWFFDPEQWNKISLYYQKKTPLVPLYTFLKPITENYNLKDDLVVEKISEFSDFLLREGIFSGEDSIIIFDEKQGGFVWNKDLFEKIQDNTPDPITQLE
ncbi:MAG: hypothetical protein COX81_03120 [Candidatus Magasanikbacteria bacterium CG_4_10_14_0_2_um_filter_37_12]|uniref:Uncharacterized protein n=1 Tax=Candidatus Magasanikbacteria bacterium CG_4_10_14_0_2_um_filter_37_12 TaxID=1974637 RepID=A0A2M7V7D5_9BACT|nr:MAG: hypothetical protein COX81_03120 [Candidatus Magasanikbacteria bacterium CG_4_10_14_0_2_um_filter_37_12]